MATAASAAPIPGFTPAPTGGGDVLAHAGYQVDACFDNLSLLDTGYRPTLQVVVPKGSTLNSATALGIAQTVQVIGTCSLVGGCPTGFVNPDTATTVPLAEGETLALVRYALGSVAPQQPPICAALALDLGDTVVAPLFVTRNLVVTPYFAFGADPLDNPGTDPPIVGPSTPLPVTPKLGVGRKTIVAREGETAIGPNYPRLVRIEVGIADGETVAPLTVSDVIPDTLQYIPGSAAITGCGGTVTDIATPSGTAPGGTLARECSTITGNGSIGQITLTFQVFVPQNDAGGAPVITPASPTRAIPNTATALGTYDPPGSDPPFTVDGQDTATITAKLAPAFKSASLVVDAGGDGPTRGDTLEYTLEYEVSDYFSVALLGPGALNLVDTLGDGQTFLGCAHATTLHAAFANGVTLPPTPFTGATCSASAKDPTTGRTTITFSLGPALLPTFGPALHGDLATDTALTGRTRVVVRFRATIDDAYSANPFPGPGTPDIGIGDLVGNDLVANTTSDGNASSDGSSSSTTIGSGTFTKEVYAYNGTVPPPPGYLVAAGDSVTFRIRVHWNTSSFEQGILDDFFPVPLFSVAGFNATGEGSIAGTGTPPAPGRWTTGPGDDFTTIGSIENDVAPTVTASTVNNSVRWNYGDVPNSNGRNVDILVTLTATDTPFGDGLDFTNVANVQYRNSAGVLTANQAAASVVTRAPAVSVRKAIVASSSPACVAAAIPANYDAARSGCDALDTIDFTITLENAGRAPAYNVRVDDDGGLPAGGLTACSTQSVLDGNGAAVPTTGSLFDTSPSGGLVIATMPADLDNAVAPGERVVVTYRCTIAANAIAILPNQQIDNTARLRYYSNLASHVSDPAFNFASNQLFPGPNVRKARVSVANVQSLVKQITASSVPQTVTPNINAGETLTFLITLTLSEGIYQNVAFTDSAIALPPIGCATPGYTCTGNVSVSGTTVTVTPTPASTPGVITYTYSQQKSASGTNTATFAATNVPQRTAAASWTVGNPAPQVSKNFNPNTADASDTVLVRLGWSNANAANPMFRCVITDPIDTVNFDPATLAAVTTPAGYAVSIDTALGIVTYTATDTTNPCPTVPANGAVFSVSIRSTAVAGGVVNNTATLAGDTLPTPQTGGNAVNASGSAQLTLGRPAINTKVVSATTEPDAVTAGNVVAVGERVTYRVTYTMPDGLSQAVRLVDQMQGGLANMTYVTGSARLARSTAALTAASNPGGINAAAPNTFVTVAPQCVNIAPCAANQIRFDLGNVTNDPATGGATDSYTLEITFQVANVAANAINTTRDNRGQLVYRPQGGTTDQTLNGGVATVRIESPVVQVNKVVAQALGPGANTITYSLEITNSATGAGAGPAFDWTFGDTLPASLTNPQLVPPLPAGVSASFAGNNLTGTVTRLDPGQRVVVTYTASVDPVTATGTTITNAAATQATSLPGPNGTGGATPGAPGAPDGERTGAGGVNNLQGATAAAFTLERLGVTKTRVSAPTGYAIGDQVEYEVRISSPIGSTQSVVLADTLPAGLGFVAGSATLTTTGGPVSTTSPGIPPTVAGQIVTFDFGTVTATTAGEIVLRYRAVVRNVITNQANTQLANSATLAYFDTVSGAPISVNAVNPPAITVQEPNLDVGKSVVSGQVGSDAGDPVDFSLTVANNGAVTAHRVDVRDQMPPGLFQISNVAVASTGNAFIEGTTTVVTTANAHVTTTVNANDTLDIAAAGPDGSDYISLAPGASVTIAFRALLTNTVTPGQIVANAVRVTYASQADCPANPECRDGSGGLLADDDNDAILNNYAESAIAALIVSDTLAITKAAVPDKAPVGATVAFRHRVHVIEGTTPNVVFTDVLPPGTTYVGHGIAVGNVAMTLGNPAYGTRLGSGQTVQFDLGSVQNPANGSGTDDYVEIEIDVRIDNVAGNQDGFELSNGGETQGSDVFVTYGATPTTVHFDADPLTPGRQGRLVRVIEPVLGLTKTPLPAMQALDGIVTYVLRLSHLPESTSDAHDVTIVDTLPAGLAFVAGSVLPPGALVSASGQTLTFGVGALTQAAGATTILYRARILPSATVGVPLTNNAHMTWASVPGATGAPDSGRNGTGGLNDYATDASAIVTPNANATVDAQKTVAIAIDADGTGNLTPGDTLEYTVTLVNGTTPLIGVVFTDATPANTTYVVGSATTSAGTVAGSDPLVVNVGSMTPGSAVTIRFRVTVNAGTPAGTLIRNQGVVTSSLTVPEPTDWDGIDANGDQPTDIFVAGSSPSTDPAMRATKSVALVTDADSSGTITQGDRMRYTVAIQNVGAGPLTGVSLTDTIPADLAYVAGSATASAGTISIAGQAVNWSGIALIATGESVTATFDVTIVSVTPPQQAYVNQGTATSSQTVAVQTDGNASITDGAQPTVFYAVAGGSIASPVLDVQKRWVLGTDVAPAGTPSPGDSIAYTITVTNLGPAPAQNVRLTDPVPICTGALNPCTTYVPGSLVTSQGAIVGTSPIEVNLGTLAIGATATISFQVLVSSATANGVIVANQASVTRDGAASPVLSDDNGNPADGINPTLTPISTVAGGGLSVAKTLEGSSEPPLITGGTDVAIGEVVRFRATLTVPAGTTLSVVLRDTLPAGLAYLPNSARLSRTFDTGLSASANPGNVNGAASGTFVPLADGTGIAIVSGPTTALSVTLGSIINSDADANAETYTLEYRAVTANVAANQAGASLINAATATYRNALLQTQTLPPASVVLRVVEPQLSIAKTAEPGLASTQGATVRFTIVVRNIATGAASPAFDVRVEDALPPLFANMTVESVTSTGAFGVTDNSSGTQVAVEASRLEPGGSITVVVSSNVAGPIPPQEVTNTATVRYTSLPGLTGSGVDGVPTPGLPGTPTGERNALGGVNDYASTASANVVFSYPVLNVPMLDRWLLAMLALLFAATGAIVIARARGRSTVR